MQLAGELAIIQSVMNEGAQKKFVDEIRRPLEQQGYHIQKTLGKGAFGQVFMASSGNRSWAIKSISKVLVKKRPFLEKYIRQEIEAMHTLKHPNLVCQEKVLETPEYYFMILEYCDMGNLLTYQSKLKTKTFQLKDALDILVEVMKGLKVIHDNNYIHRDIKSENVLIKNTEAGYKYKIADFGFARPVSSGTASTICGTEKYMAPQILKNTSYNKSVDIWALGILLYFMLFAEYPFKGHDLLADIDRKCRYGFSLRDVVSKVQKLKEITPQLQDFFRGIFIVDSKKRMTFSNLTAHPLFAAYRHDFQQSPKHRKSIQKQLTVEPDPLDQNGQPQQNYLQQDQTRAELITQQVVLNSSNKVFAKEIQTTSFEVSKIAFLRECANDFFMTGVLSQEERIAIRYYVLRAFIYYSKALVSKLEDKVMPPEFFEYKLENWGKFTGSEQYRVLLNYLKEENLKGDLQFQDAYTQACSILDRIRIKNFKQKLTQTVQDLDFQSFKIPYRSTTSCIYQRIHQNKQLQSHIKNKLKLKLFCCHMINRIFDQNALQQNFQFYIKWLERDPRSTTSKLDFCNFKKWILCETKQHLDTNIDTLHKIFFSR